jgi:hypothetical protein
LLTVDAEGSGAFAPNATELKVPAVSATARSRVARRRRSRVDVFIKAEG